MSKDVTEAWRENAGDWLTWARTPGHDVAFWELNLPALLDLIRDADGLPAGAAVADIGCGEGRVGRALAELGYRVRGLDSSLLLADAAREAGGFQEVVRGDATALPWPDDSFDLALAFMTLMDMPDAIAAVGEMARVLRPHGWLCLAVGHPLYEPLPETANYFEGRDYDGTVTRDGITMRFIGHERPLSHYTAALARAGFVIEELREPRPAADWPGRHPRLADAVARPFFLHIRARLL